MRLDPNGSDTCTDHAPITLGDFVKKTLPNEWVESWGNTPDGIEALKAGAIAVRTFAISSYHAEVIAVGGQNYFCAKAWRQKFDPGEVISNSPNSVAAVNATNNVVMTHPTASTREVSLGWPTSLRTGAIDAQYRDETGWFTANGAYPWLKEVFDPISPGSPQQGIGQHGSRRWAWGVNDSGEAFPKWDYRRILAHYYSEVDFVGITPDPPNDNRGNIVEVEGIPPNGGLIMCKGEKLPNVAVNFQNVGNSLPVDPCPGTTNPQTLVGYHLYRQDGSLACNNCVGLRAMSLCRSGGSTLPPGQNDNHNDLEIFIPNDPAIVNGNTYLLRFDLRRNGVWQGKDVQSFAWPPQDIPVTICNSPGGGSGPTVNVNRPPAVVSYNSLVGGRYGFSWSGRNATRYDLQWKSKENWESAYPNDWVALSGFQNMDATATNFSSRIDCGQDHRDWQFRLRAKNDSQTGNWVTIQSRMRIWPFPWLSYWTIGGLVLNSDPGPWQRPADIINYGGGTFNWTASGNQSWIATNSSGQDIGSLGVVISKPGGINIYNGMITVNMMNPSPSPFCTAGQPTALSYNVPVAVTVADHFLYQYLPIILKNSP